MKKALVSLLLVFAIYIVVSLFYLDKYSFLCPINYQGDFSIRSDSMGSGSFGTRRSGRRMHQGIDLLAEVGDSVSAARSGLVVKAKYNRGMGNYVIIRHSPSLVTIYGHLHKICVRQNQFVRQGDIIGLVGKTGNANYSNMLAHLHFEIRENGTPRDPLKYLD